MQTKRRRIISFLIVLCICVSILPLQAKAVTYGRYEGIDFSNANISTQRKAALTKAMQMVTVQWTCPADFPTWRSSKGVLNTVVATDGTRSTKFIKGKTYTGIPYSMADHTYDDISWDNAVSSGKITTAYMTGSYYGNGETTAHGSDCSYFVYLSLKAANAGSISYKNTKAMLSSSLYKKISWSELIPADLFLMNGHVMMFVGMSGSEYAVFECDAGDSKCSYNTYTKSQLSSYNCYRYTNFDDSSSAVTHTVDSSYGTNFTAYPKEKITAENIFDENHRQISSGAWIGTSDQCTIHEVYTDGCCKVTYPLDKGGTKTVFSKISLFNTSAPGAECSCSAEYAGEYVCATTSKDLMIRSGHGSSHNEVGRIPKGATVYVSKASGTGSNDWAHVEYNGVSGYSSMEYLTKKGPDYADLGSEFIAVILHTESWMPIGVDDAGFVHLEKEVGASHQVWKFIRQTDGSYTVSSAKTGKLLEMYCGETRPGNPVAAVSDDWGGNYQRWYLAPQGDGYVFVNAHYLDTNNMAMDLPNNDPQEGREIITYPRNNTGAQIWTIYTGESAQLTGPTLSVEVGDSASKTRFTWSEVYGETKYDLKIWRGQIWDGEPYHVEWGGYSGVELNLPAGTYQAYVDGVNYYYCVMGNVVTFTVGEHSHSYASTVTNPTCTDQGYTTYTCRTCGYSYKGDYTNALGHSYSYKVTKNPTLSESGTLTGTCSRCAGTTAVTLPQLNTSDYTYKVTKEASCNAEGVGEYTWKNTSYGTYKFTVAIPKTTNHSYSYKATKNPTLSESGTLTGTCSRCSATTTVTLPKLNTTDYTYKVVKEPSYTEAGVGRYTWNNTNYGTFYFDVPLEKLNIEVTGIEIAAKPSKTIYQIGESLDTTGLKVKVSYNDGNSEIITEGFMVSGFDSTTAGAKTVTVSHGGKTASFTVTVEAPREEEGTIKLELTNGSGGVGSIVEMKLSISDVPAGGISALDLSVSYDPTQLRLVEVPADGGIMGDALFGYDVAMVPFALTWNNLENYSPNGILATLRFEVLSMPKEGVVRVSVTSNECSNVEEEIFEVSAAEGEIQKRTPGDVNGDGKVTQLDVTRLRKYLAGGWNVEIDMDAADVNGDNKITQLDVTRLRKYLAGGWGVELK